MMMTMMTVLYNNVEEHVGLVFDWSTSQTIGIARIHDWGADVSIANSDVS